MARRASDAGSSAKAGGDAALFARLGIRREQDLVLHLPIRYEDETRITPIASARSGETVQVEGVVERQEIVARPRRTLVVDLRDDTGAIALRFFHFYGSQLRQFASGNRVRALGEARGGLFGMEMVHPRYRLVDEGEPLPQALTPVYPTVSGLGQARLRAAILRALRTLDWRETAPPDATARLGLPSAAEALRAIHQPAPDTPASALHERSTPAWRRVIFDELLAQQLSLKRARAARAGQLAPALGDDALARRLLDALPFRLTGAQRRAWREIGRELAATQPMNRLLQGDVGSGKTVIAALAAAQAIGSGWQAAMMAPTEILAEQHLRKIGPWLERIGARIAWLSGSLKESEKKAVRARTAAGEVDLLIGTHALIEDTVAFARL
ncbi:MAG TPA: DEAD/DEAH box helicase, partial [Burkholderiaceae bacterium]|nr:DEAD/DEAH box helicase [Burkholderiaceae bacterium]